MRRTGFAALLIALLACPPLGAAETAPVVPCKVIARFPHATTSYTEGLLYKDGLFYEGTGMEGHSEVLAVDPQSGTVRQRVALPPNLFGEGIVDWGPNLLEWTWQTQTGFVLDRHTLKVLREFHYTGEGWGMTRTAKELITSDGSSVLRFRDPETFAETRHLVVHDGEARIDQLNELEYVKGVLYANVWHSDRIARISPTDGRVLSWIDCTGLLPNEQKVNAESVLNGIAYDAEHDRLFVTGKQWPWIFEIRVASGSGQ